MNKNSGDQMDVSVITGELSEFDAPILHDLRAQNAAASAELILQMEMIRREFCAQFPELEMTANLTIEITTMSAWLTHHI